jgi:MoaA/NifB/PqqE/SkfB family radical SAM enzyme
LKLRREAKGLHLYDRSSGLHVLLDESPIPRESVDLGPAVMSIALTNACDLSCPFCYAPKSNHSLQAENIIGWCRELDGLGTLEVAFGGGEPTLYRSLPELCRTLWRETGLGISITTHGQHLTRELVDGLTGVVSVVRVSIDGPEPYYSSIRRRPLRHLVECLDYVRGKIPLGINTVVNLQTLPRLGEMAAIVKRLGAIDWLLLPEVRDGEFVFTDSEWKLLDKWITEVRSEIDVRVSTEAAEYLKCPVLIENQIEDYAHISADGYLRRCSYVRGGIALQGSTITTALRDLRNSA